MILLTSTNDRLTAYIDTAGPLDVHTSWVDTVTASGAITPGRTNSTITAPATVTSIAGAPAAGTQRNVKTVHMRNKSASACTVLVQHTDGTVVSQLFQAALNPGAALQYTDQGGFVLL